METVTIAHAKEHLEELIERAARGEDVRIAGPEGAEVKLVTAGEPTGSGRKPRRLGLLAGTLPPPPEGFFDPMTEEELKDWYGDDS